MGTWRTLAHVTSHEALARMDARASMDLTASNRRSAELLARAAASNRSSTELLSPDGRQGGGIGTEPSGMHAPVAPGLPSTTPDVHAHAHTQLGGCNGGFYGPGSTAPGPYGVHHPASVSVGVHHAAGGAQPGCRGLFEAASVSSSVVQASIASVVPSPATTLLPGASIFNKVSYVL